MTDYNAIERLRWGGPSPFAGKDTRTEAQKRVDEERDKAKGETLGDAYHRLIGLGFVPANESEQIAMLRVLEKVWDEAVRHA